jgi:hypothetical protein
MKPQTKTVDLSFLESFAKGNTEKIIFYLKMYLDTAPKLFDQLLNHALGKKWEDVYLKAHNLKAQVQYVGVIGMKELLEEIELISKEKEDKSSLAELVFAAVKLNNHAISELSSYINSHSLLKS